MLSSSTTGTLDNDSAKELYLRRLHKEGYPSTAEKHKEFNKTFYDDLGLEGDERKSMTTNVGKLKHGHIRKFSIPKSMEGNLELMKMFYEVAADYAKKWTTATSPAQTRAKRRSSNTTNEDDRAPIKTTSSIDSDVDMTDIQEEEDEVESELDKLKGQLAEKDGEIMQLKNRNEELAETLKMKDEECQQLEEQAERIKKTTESDTAQLMEEKRHLEERVRSLEEIVEKAGTVKESDVDKLEEKIRSLEEALRKKDIVVETLELTNKSDYMEKKGETVQPPAIIEREELAKSRKAFKRSIQDEDMPLFTLRESVSSTLVKEETVNSDAEMIPSGDKERVISELMNGKNKGSHQRETENTQRVVKPDASKEILTRASILNRYLRYMHKNRYPQTEKKRKEYNKGFYDELNIQENQKKKVAKAVFDLDHNIKKSVIPRSMMGNPELVKLFNEVAANYAKRRVILKSPSKKETHRLPRNIGFEDDETSDANVNLIDSDVHMESIQEGGGENELGGRPEAMNCEVMQLKIDELTKALEKKDEEKRFLDEWAHSLEETLKKKEMEAEAAKMTKKEIPDDVAKWEEDKRCLESKLRIMAETNEDLKNKNQALEEALREKDQMLKTFLNMHSTIQNLTKNLPPF